MKKTLFILALLGIFFLSLSHASAVYVNGYYRSNGTYVNGYERTAPDGNPYNNYGYPGNYNPNTGKITGGNPDTYLNNYYNNSPGSTYSPNYSYPTTPTCPINSYYDGISSCKCNSGYVVSGGSCVSGNSACYSQLGYSSSYDSLSNKCKCNYGYSISGGSCVSDDTICQNQIGYNSSYDSLSDKCKCDYGYVIGTSGQCISTSSYCSNQLGSMSQYNSLSKKCECMTGYEFDGSSCVYKQTNYSYPSGYTASLTNCPINSYAAGTSCYCNTGYQSNSNKDGCEPIPSPPTPAPLTCNYGFLPRNGQCISYAQDCTNTFGSNVIGSPGTENNSSCNCVSGYEWNSAKTACIKAVAPQYNQQSNIPQSVKSCGEGYALSLNKKTCIIIPQNSHSIDNGKDVWLCNDGYLEKGNSCIVKPSQSLTPTSINNGAPKIEQKKSFWNKFKFW